MSTRDRTRAAERAAVARFRSGDRVRLAENTGTVSDPTTEGSGLLLRVRWDEDDFESTVYATDVVKIGPRHA